MATSAFFKGLSGRLLLMVMAPVLLTIGAIVTLAAVQDYRELRRAEERVLAASAAGAATELDMRNDRWNNVAQVMAMAQTTGLFGRRKASTEFARSVLVSFPLTFGAYIAYEPNADAQDAAALKDDEVAKEAMDSTGRFVPYWFTEPGTEGAARSFGLRPRIGMESMEFYQAPKNAKNGAGPVVTEPFIKGGVLMVSHSCPILMQSKFAGVAGVDRSLDVLVEIATRIKSRFGADVFIVSAGGRFIATTAGAQGKAAGAQALEMKSVAETAYAPIGRQWQEGSENAGVIEGVDPVLNEPSFYATAPVKTGGWMVVVRRTKADVMRAADAAILRNIMLGAIGLVLVGGLMFATTRAVAGRVRRAAEAADRIARGDLTQVVQESASADETGQLTRSMAAMDRDLNALVGSVKQAGIRLNSTATEIAATSKQQEASSATFGAASNQIAAAIKEISATGQDLVRTMQSVSGMAVETADLAGAGRTGLQGMEAVMRDLDRATASIAEKLGAINDRSQRINTIGTTITKVADQTNILSINAAIEAEKAGEYGAGFLVIAREIRRLADQTASATLDIEQMVQQMQAAVSAGVMEMDRFRDQVRRGVHDVAAAGSQMTEIIDRVNRSTESFKQVNESMQAQSEGAQQISDAMASLVANANQTMQSVREFGKAATDLQAAIALLRQAAGQFKLRE
jgi:methyl-accepting chemotaxis protein